MDDIGIFIMVLSILLSITFLMDFVFYLKNYGCTFSKSVTYDFFLDDFDEFFSIKRTIILYMLLILPIVNIFITLAGLCIWIWSKTDSAIKYSREREKND